MTHPPAVAGDEPVATLGSAVIGSAVIGSVVIEEAQRIAGTAFTRVDRVARGYSRASYRAEAVDGTRYAIRVATADGPSTGTEMTLGREAAYLGALAPTGVPVPRLYGQSSDGSFLVTEWASGRPGVGGLSTRDRERIYLRYVDALATLHRVDVRTLDVPGAAASDPAAGARAELERWRRVLAAKVVRPRPLARFALAVLSRVALPRAERLAVCHGDPGPGNFLHDGERVTALLDWEFAHVGDPIDDLAWWAFRGHELTGGCGNLARQLERWSETTGCAVPPESLAYYKALTAVRFYISLVVMLETSGGTVDRALPLRVLSQVTAAIPRLLAEVEGRVLPAYAPPGAVPIHLGDEAVGVLRSALGDVALPAATTSEARRRLVNALGLVDHLQACLNLGAALAAEERAELARVLGRPVDDVTDGEKELLGMVDDPRRYDDLLEFFARSGRRGSALWAPLRGPAPETASGPTGPRQPTE